MMSSETHREETAQLQEEGVVVDVYEWLNLHKLSVCLAVVYFVYYLLIIVRVRQQALYRFLSVFSSFFMIRDMAVAAYRAALEPLHTELPV